ncbi:hypothetical protein MTR67_007134 [Solanum verrucosum]|uniref:Uncharacterized protein n=1 Tax=Solanum verrucosum TaxID=315347 RepID=A0AAF0TCT8_SOLVR|nr:hypothetical protein MTR67_007134 [Solanum verrucosum]
MMKENFVVAIPMLMTNVLVLEDLTLGKVVWMPLKMTKCVTKWVWGLNRDMETQYSELKNARTQGLIYRKMFRRGSKETVERNAVKGIYGGDLQKVGPLTLRRWWS